MGGFEQVKDMTAAVVSSYDERICAVGEIVEKGLAMLDQCRLVEQAVQYELRERLARVESLRKKDFDQLMAPILIYQSTREQEIRQFMNFFLKTQRELASQLKRMIEAEIFSRVPDLEKIIQTNIEAAREHVIGFQKEQAVIGRRMRHLFLKQEDLTLKEFRKTVDILCGELGLEKEEKLAMPAAVLSHC
ncbi:MAG: hypothetical protein QME66_00600 [Candidatus Eisenbacteria bacterium]|nr:hypothetical protein [Candidatus Eisenbacteria bacterium]